ncbi:dipeptidase [Paenibacillus yanchengensis]|uniref:Dipeptidase n=1 Tax=Paenibacillus yanchengensis TaxID=2035833 RepID=A0ABW4YM54_9BACL
MKTIDFHCDALYKLLDDKELSFATAMDTESTVNEKLDVTLDRLVEADSLLQVFAVFVHQSRQNWLLDVLESIDLFYSHIISHPKMSLVRNQHDLATCIEQNKIGAMLSLEGCDGLDGNPALLRLLHRLGLRALSLTWNNANWAADGVLEQRNAGLSSAGAAFVKQCEELGIILDISHLGETSFWDLAAITTRPIIASHSNAFELCPHPRNLNNNQLKYIIENNGLIGITYVPYFLTTNEQATIDDVIRHIEYICELGGQNSIMLGSDFDGIDQHVLGLAHPGQVNQLKESLYKRFDDALVEQFLHKNALTFLQQHLPE